MTDQLTLPQHTNVATGNITAGTVPLPAIIHGAGDKARWRFLDFFAATIRNPHTREAYWRAVWRFFDWCEGQGVGDKPRQKILYTSAEINRLHFRTGVKMDKC